MDSNELRAKLTEYEERIRHVVALFVQTFGQANPGPLWRQGKLKRVGLIGTNDEFEYSLHGRGCTVELNNECVAFDFDKESNFVYTPFQFLMFLPEDTIEHSELEVLFLKLCEEGQIEHVEGRGVRLRT